MPEVMFREAKPEDLAYLTQLRLRTIDEHVRNAGEDLSLDEHQVRASTRLECCQILEIEGRRAGMIKVVRSGGTWNVEQFQIEPAFQNKGIGADVLRQVQQQARSSSARLLLEVLKGNPALRLYERLGFVRLAEVDGVVEMESAV